MDPNAVLENILNRSVRILNTIDQNAKYDGDLPESVKDQIVEDTESLAEGVQSMNDWISNGGFLPEKWRR